jgi:type IV secretory pathway VirB4 component
MGRDIGSLMRDVVVQFVDKHIERINTEDFSISDNPDSLMESLCPILSGKSHDELLDNDDVATDHHTRKAIQVIVYEIIDHIRLIEDASKH